MGYDILSNDPDELKLIMKMLERRAFDKEHEMHILLNQLHLVREKLRRLNGDAPVSPSC